MIFIAFCLLALTLGCSVATNNQTPSALTPVTSRDAKKTRQAAAAGTPRNIATVLAQTPRAVDYAMLAHGPIVGAVTSQEAVVWIQTNTHATVQARYSDQPDLAGALTTEAQPINPDANFTAKIALRDLTPSTEYYLDVLVNGVSQLRAPYTRFKTFPPVGAVQDFTFAQLTDFSASPELAAQTFVSVDKENPDFVIIGGDFPHGKHKDLDSTRANYELMYDTRTSPSIADFVARILGRYAVVHMWDDHDSGMDNGDKTNRLLPLMRRVLEEMFPTYSLPQKGNGDWQKFSYAQADFFVLDARSQRDPNEKRDGPDKSMLDGNRLGAEGQLEWLKQGLKQSTAQWKFIISPVAFNPTAKPEDAWGAFRYEHDAIVKFTRDNHITNVIVISGDMHAGAIDNGAHSGFPEMLTSGPNGGGCISTPHPGEWSEGFYGQEPGPCNGYGVARVYADPPRVELQVKDEQGRTRVNLIVPSDAAKK